MSLPQSNIDRRQLAVSVILVSALLVLGWFVYRPALGGTFLLDDISNLGDLRTVTDFESATGFVLSGTAGPLGRPIALATFVPQASHWDSSAASFLTINILIHLLNGLLLYMFVRQLARELRAGHNDAEFLALVTTAMWLLLPLLASSTLMIVQRMTTLSATFMLGGLNGYLLARRSIESRPYAALGGMTAALVAGTLLAVLTKENGALLPVLVLVMEATLLTSPRQIPRSRWRAWSAVFLLAPAVAIVVFVLSQASYSDNMVMRRDFNAWERLLTESRILWDYVINAFVAQPGRFGPFYDAYPITRSLFEPLTFIAAMSWPILIAGAIVARRRYSVAAFAVLWFVAGHLLESTTFPLELYFEHRNYVPIIGPVFALAYAATSVKGTYVKYARGAMALYLLVNIGVLLSVTSLWGKPLQAASYWHVQRPDSVRAATTLATRQMTEIDPRVAMITLQEFALRYPQHTYIRLPELTLACRVMPDHDHSAIVERVNADLQSVAFSFSAGTMLDQLLTEVATGSCSSVGPADVKSLAEALLSNARYAHNDEHQRLHSILMARIARLSGDTEATLEYLAQASDFWHGDDLNMMMVTALVEENRFEEAREYLKSALERLPWQPLRRLNSKMKLGELSNYVIEAEKLARTGDEPDFDNSTESE
jgi:hypothetical protein